MDEISKNKFNRHRIYFVLLFTLGFIALIYAISDLNCSSLNFSMDKLIFILGVFVSIVGLFATTYFVILAMDAYAHIKEIEKVKIEIVQVAGTIKTQYQEATLAKTNMEGDIVKITEAKNTIDCDISHINQAKEIIEHDVKTANLQIEKVENILKVYSEMLYEDLNERIALEGRGKTVGTDKNKIIRRNALKLRQARLSYKFPMLAMNIREKLLLQLGDIGETIDVLPIQDITEDENEPENLKKIAEIVLQQLKKKTGRR